LTGQGWQVSALYLTTITSVPRCWAGVLVMLGGQQAPARQGVVDGCGYPDVGHAGVGGGHVGEQVGGASGTSSGVGSASQVSLMRGL